MKIFLPALALVAICLLNLASPLRVDADEPAAADFPPKDVQFFQDQVLPILKENCFECHGGKPEVEGQFRITSRAGVVKGGELGPGVNLDALEESELLSAVKYESVEMPPGGKLPVQQIGVIEKWVKLGLPWSQKVDYGVAAKEQRDGRGDGRDYWAYQSIERPEIPQVTNDDWINDPIDAFILAKLEAAELKPAPKADKIALIRRAYYDLTGLPPSPEEVDRFLADDSPDAFERIVDQLLDSPQYGERWGRHWLDLVRYAETHGYERDSPKPEAWRFRDYVIKSFNDDKPYDQFVIEQLAGDELPKVTLETLTATGFYRLGLWDDEPADRELARYDGLDDIVKTASEVVLGTSMGCVRCHSHKADPIDHQEYYRLLAYFHDVAHPNRENLRRWVTDEDQVAYEQKLREKAERERQWTAEIASIDGEFRRLAKSQLGLDFESDAAKMDDRFLFPDSRKQGQQWEYTFDKPSIDWIQPDYSTTSWDRGLGGFGRQGTPGAVVRTNWSSSDIWLRKWFEIDEIPRFLAFDLHNDEDCEIYLNGIQIHSTKGYVRDYRRVSLDAEAIKSLVVGRNVIALHCLHTGGGQYIDVGLIVAPPRLALAAALSQYGAKILGSEKANRFADLRKQLEGSRKQKIAPVGISVMSVSQRPHGPVHVLIRGNPHSKGEPVEPAVPSALRTKPPVVSGRPNAEGISGKRLALARWLFNRDNPLTARVIANRIWHYHFGRGIVPTPNDFGQLGESPTHPALLDWLASEIRDGDWRLKRIHKLIMLSSTWQMSSQATQHGLARDPGNSLLWRFNMRRLSSEEVRDSVLAATGELNLKQGGPSIYVPIPQAVLAGQSRPGAGWGKSSPEEAARRSVYIHVKRSLLVPVLEMHDQAATDSSCPVRYVTTVPTQSLGMLNGEFMNRKARNMANRITKEFPDDAAEQIRRAIRLTTGRRVGDDEVARDMAFLAALKANEKLTEAQALNAYCLLALNTNEFVYLD